MKPSLIITTTLEACELHPANLSRRMKSAYLAKYIMARLISELLPDMRNQDIALALNIRKGNTGTYIRRFWKYYERDKGFEAKYERAKEMLGATNKIP